MTAALKSWEPPPKLTVSEWADRHRVLSPESSAEPGPWRTSRAPYLREVMDCLSASSAIERVICMWSSQVAKTETLNNACGYATSYGKGATDDDAYRSALKELRKHSSANVKRIVIVCSGDVAPKVSEKLPNWQRHSDASLVTSSWPPPRHSTQRLCRMS